MAHVEMAVLLKVASHLVPQLKKQGHAVIHPGDYQSVWSPHVLPGSSAESHGNQDRVSAFRQVLKRFQKMLLHFLRVPVIKAAHIFCRDAGAKLPLGFVHIFL